MIEIFRCNNKGSEDEPLVIFKSNIKKRSNDNGFYKTHVKYLILRLIYCLNVRTFLSASQFWLIMV